MKKFVIIFCGVLSFAAQAQKSKVESAAIYLRNNEIEEARNAIEEAVLHPDTKTDPKAWFYYTSIYDSISRNKVFNQLINEPNLVEKFYTGSRNCIQYDVKNRYGYYCKEQALINSAFMAFNKGIECYEAKDFDGALKFYRMVLEVLPYDKNGDLRKNNLSETNITLYMAYAAIQGEKRDSAKKFLNRLMELNYDDPVIYVQMVVMNLEEGDTAKALNYAERGKMKYPANKDLTNLELNIYLSQGKTDVLIDKLNAAIESDPYSSLLYYVRGNVYDNLGSELNKKAKNISQELTTIKSKAQTEKNQNTKQKLTNEANKKKKEVDELMQKMKMYISNAETDYKKAIELDPGNIDAYFNLGAITNNKSTEIAEQINNLTAPTQAEYDRKYKPLKNKLDSILNIALVYFNEALVLAEQKTEDTEENRKIKYSYLNDIYFSLQQVYANLGDERKTMEMKRKREELNKN